jgi:hypothetical protein
MELLIFLTRTVRAPVRSRLLRRSALFVSIATFGCVHAAQTALPAGPESAVEHSLYLLGDAGDPAPGGEPVLAALRTALENGAHRTVVFLGDNIYPRGLPPAGDLVRADAERRISAQIETVRSTGASSLFIPGNHDWVYQTGGDPVTLRRQQDWVLEKGGPDADWLPRDACPGPALRDVDARFRLVVIDTEWWLSSNHGLKDPGEHCSARDPAAFLDALGHAITDAGNLPVLVLGHHPLQTGGVHGGHFPFVQHIFPLRALHPTLWIPLPVIGSLYPAVRAAGVSNQDLSGSRYRRMRAALDSVFRAHPPLIYAAGHDHNLQVLDGGSAHGAWRLLVSGSGSFAHAEPVARIGSTRFASGRAGWIQVDFHADGEITLSVVAVDRTGVPAVLYRERAPALP